MRIKRNNGILIDVEIGENTKRVSVDGNIYNCCFPTTYDGSKVLFFYATPTRKKGIRLTDNEYEKIWGDIFNSNNSHDFFNRDDLYKANKMIDNFGKLKVRIGDMNNVDEVVCGEVHDVPILYYTLTNKKGVVTNVQEIPKTIPTYIIDDIVIKFKANGEWYYSYSPEHKALTSPQVDALEFIYKLSEVVGFGIEYMAV